MSSITRLLLLASVLTFAQAQNVGAGLDPCAQKCVNDVLNKGGALGCAAGEASCICAKPDFGFGVRDCAQQACPSLVAQATNFVQTFCATATLAKVTTPGTAAPAGATTSTSSGDRPTPSSAPQGSVTSASSTGASPTASGAQSSSSSTATPGAKGDSSEKSSTDDDEEEQGGLSVGAKAGIGITVAIVATGLIGLAFWLFRRSQNRNSISTGDFHISGPMPGSGRDYADSHLEYKEGNHSELELRSRRYEDMIPRQQPASMI